MTDAALPRRQPIALRFPSVMIFLAILALFTVGVTILSEGFGIGVISTSFIKTLGKTLCLCLVALAMDLVWGYCGILSLGHMAFFGLGGYAIGMWLMYARTEAGLVPCNLSGGYTAYRCCRISASNLNTVRLRGMETGISEASKRVSIFSFATQGGKQESFYFRQGNWVQAREAQIRFPAG